jgi:hypothetical protein
MNPSPSLTTEQLGSFIKFIMSSKERLGTLLSSKLTASHPPKPKDSRVIKYVTLANTQDMRRQPTILNKMHLPRKNHTETTKYLRKSEAGAQLQRILGEHKCPPINNSRSVHITNTLDPSSAEPNREEKLLALREEKLEKMKHLYSMKGKSNKAQL